MAIELKQQLRISQQLVMTPQLQQAIKLLQLNQLELVSMVEQEMQENPCLEEDEREEQTPDEFSELRDRALERGFTHCESGPLVRSSYHAGEQYEHYRRRVHPLYQEEQAAPA